jgi:hypothetical protein
LGIILVAVTSVSIIAGCDSFSTKSCTSDGDCGGYNNPNKCHSSRCEASVNQACTCYN